MRGGKVSGGAARELAPGGGVLAPSVGVVAPGWSAQARRVTDGAWWQVSSLSPPY